MELVSCTNLTKDYGRGRGIFDLNLSLSAGEVLGFLGPNGAGKSTTIRLLMGFIKADRGEARLFGEDAFAGHVAIAKRLAYVAGEVAPIDNMSASSYLFYTAALHGMKKAEAKREILDLADYFELDLKAKIKSMSKGNKQKVSLIAAFMLKADLILLDEPSSGLDPLMQARLIDKIRAERERGAAILLSSHIFEEIEKCADRILFIREGRLVEELSQAELSGRKLRHVQLSFVDEAAAAEAFALLQQDSTHISSPKLAGTSLSFDLSGSIAPIQALLSSPKMLDLNLSPLSLEEQFMQLYAQKEGTSCK